MYLIVFERQAAIRSKGFGLAVRRLSRWYSFKRLYEERVRGSRRVTFIVGDLESLEVLKLLYNAYGYVEVYSKHLAEDRGVQELFNAIFKHTIDKLGRDSVEKSIVRKLLEQGPLLDGGVVGRVAKELGVDARLVRRVRRRLLGIAILALKVNGFKLEAFHALGYPVFEFKGFPPAYLVPLGLSVEEVKARRGVDRDVIGLLKLVTSECRDVEGLQELSKCEKAVAQRYHAQWRRLLPRVRRHLDYIHFKTDIIKRELEKHDVKVVNMEIWRVRGRRRWSPHLRRLLLEMLERNPELTVKEACTKIGISYSTAKKHLKEDREYKEIMAKRALTHSKHTPTTICP